MKSGAKATPVAVGPSTSPSTYTSSQMARGFVYLAAVVDWFSLSVLAWRMSITLEKEFCLDRCGRQRE